MKMWTKTRCKEAFLQVRTARGDRGSADLYVADPKRNALFLAKCRQLELKVSDYILNKTLLNARKNKLLTGLHSVKTSIDYEDIAFACEFAATELRYKIGVSIDDIVCDPCIAQQFDTIAAKLSPGHKSFEYSGPRKLDHRLSYRRWFKKGGPMKGKRKIHEGVVQGEGCPGGGEGRQDDQRAGEPVCRPRHADPWLEEAAPRGRRVSFRRRRQAGQGQGPGGRRRPSCSSRSVG